MKQILLIGLVIVSSLYLYLNQDKGYYYGDNDSNYSNLTDILPTYLQWKQEFGIQFDLQEDMYRLEVFAQNYAQIQAFNQQHNDIKLAMNQFGALNSEEFVQMYLNPLRDSKQKLNKNIRKSTVRRESLPDQVNWVQKGAVLPPRNQGSCGSCWAFSTVGGLQGLMYIVTGNIEYLSVQQVTSCVPAQYLDNGVEGCGGGLPLYAYQYTAQNGIESDSDYPYVNASGGKAAPCQYNSSKVAFQNEGVGEVAEEDVNGMMENLVNQPLSIGIDASSVAFQFYQSGVIQSKYCGHDINHSILLVGYDTSASTPYWIVQNSWGTSWGMNGYAYMEISEGQGACSINMQVNYPTSINQGK